MDSDRKALEEELRGLNVDPDHFRGEIKPRPGHPEDEWFKKTNKLLKQLGLSDSK